MEKRHEYPIGTHMEFNPYKPTETQSIEELLTIDEIAALLKVPKSWIYERTRKRNSEQLPFIKLGKYLRFEEQGICAYLQRFRKSA